MKKHLRAISLFAGLAMCLAIASTAAAVVTICPDAVPNNGKNAVDYDWTPAQIAEFVKQPWTKDELRRMGEGNYILNKSLYQKKHLGDNLTPAQLYENGRNVWFPQMMQYGVGMSMKDFKKIWIDEGKWKDPNHYFIDTRMESEWEQAHPLGAIRVDTGLAYWQIHTVVPKQNATVYLMCKSGSPDNGGDRGALIKRMMIDMGYTGPIYNLTDGFRGWCELGYPVINRHGQFTHIKGTFQQADPYQDPNKKGIKVGV